VTKKRVQRFIARRGPLLFALMGMVFIGGPWTYSFVTHRAILGNTRAVVLAELALGMLVLAPLMYWAETDTKGNIEDREDSDHDDAHQA
jgi:hypothetical protein